MTHTKYIEFCIANSIPSFALRDMPDHQTVQHVPNGYRYDTRKGTRGECRGPVELPDMSHLNSPDTVRIQKVVRAAWAKRRKP